MVEVEIIQYDHFQNDFFHFNLLHPVDFYEILGYKVIKGSRENITIPFSLECLTLNGRMPLHFYMVPSQMYDDDIKTICENLGWRINVKTLSSKVKVYQKVIENETDLTYAFQFVDLLAPLNDFVCFSISNGIEFSLKHRRNLEIVTKEIEGLLSYSHDALGFILFGSRKHEWFKNLLYTPNGLQYQIVEKMKMSYNQKGYYEQE